MKKNTYKRKVNCPHCRQKADFMTSKEYYGKDYQRNVYVCHSCNASIGTHGRSNRPLGTLANKELRQLRKRCHQALDVLWEGSKETQMMTRKDAYVWLRKTLNVTKKEAHIGKLDKRQCRIVIREIKKRESSI